MLSKDAIETLLAAGAKFAPIQTPDQGFAVPLPPGYTLGKIAPLEPPLTHTKQLVTLHDVESLIAYIEQFKDDDSRIFAEPGFLAEDHDARLVAVLDYHKAEEPGRAEHVATYAPRYSEAWLRWHKVCAEPLRQVAFAELIEECRADIVLPDAAKLIDIVRTFKASKSVEFDSLVYQNNGSVKLAYSEKVAQAGGPSGELPEQMQLGIPVYYKGEYFRVDLFVRYRVSGGAVVFSLKLDRSDLVEETAFEGITKKVAQTTAVPVHSGRLA